MVRPDLVLTDSGVFATPFVFGLSPLGVPCTSSDVGRGSSITSPWSSGLMVFFNGEALTFVIDFFYNR